MAVMLERDVEAYLGKGLKARGCLYYKFVSPGNVGVPDRIVVLPNGHVIFVELKTSRGRLSDAQRLQIGRLQANKADAHVLYGMGGVDLLLREVDYMLALSPDGDHPNTVLGDVSKGSVEV